MDAAWPALIPEYGAWISVRRTPFSGLGAALILAILALRSLRDARTIATHVLPRPGAILASSQQIFTAVETGTHTNGAIQSGRMRVPIFSFTGGLFPAIRAARLPVTTALRAG